jgi:hypothetical protein
VSTAPPENWQEVWKGIEKMREKGDAPGNQFLFSFILNIFKLILWDVLLLLIRLLMRR